MPEQQAEYLDWLMDAEPDRTVDDKKYWAAQHGVAYNTVQKWQRDARFREQHRRRVAEQATDPQLLQRITKTLAEAGARGDTKSATEYMKYLERISPSERVDRDVELMGLTDSELVARIEAALDGFVAAR